MKGEARFIDVEVGERPDNELCFREVGLAAVWKVSHGR